MNMQARHLYSYEYRSTSTIPVPSTVRMVRWAWWDGGLLRPPHVLMHLRPPTSCAAAELYLYANMHRTYEHDNSYLRGACSLEVETTRRVLSYDE